MVEYELMPHQKEAVYQSTFKRDLFLAWEMGVGKTPTAINIMRQKYHAEGRIMRTLILAPLIVLKQWKKEIAKFSKISPNAVKILDQPVKKRIEIINSGVGGIYIMNYDVMQSKDILLALTKWKPEILIADESHSLKNFKSKRARNVAILSDICRHRYLLSGTPILNSAMDIFMQYRILDGGETFGKNFFAFRHSYFEDQNASFAGKQGYFPKFLPRPSTYKIFNKKLEEKTLRIIKKDVLKDLPPLIEEELFVDLSTEQKKLYAQMKRDFVAFVDGEIKDGKPRAVVAKLALTKTLRLQEIVTGYARVDGEEEVHVIKENPRLVVMRDLLADLTPNHKVIVWAVFKENYKQLRSSVRLFGN